MPFAAVIGLHTGVAIGSDLAHRASTHAAMADAGFGSTRGRWRLVNSTRLDVDESGQNAAPERNVGHPAAGT